MKFSNQIILLSAFVLGVVVSIGMAQDQKKEIADSPAAIISLSQTQEEEKLTIKDIMKEAHDSKTGLAKKVATKKATAEEKARLQTLYEELAKLSPPKGTAKEWKEKTDKLIEAAKLAVEDDPSFPKKLKAATDCKGCHKVHK